MPLTSLASIYQQATSYRVVQQVRLLDAGTVGGPTGYILPRVQSLRWNFEIGRVPVMTVEFLHNAKEAFGMNRGPYGLRRNHRLDVWIGLQEILPIPTPVYSAIVFSGRVDSVSRRGGAVVLECVGESGVLEKSYEGTVITLNGQTANAAVTTLLQEAGVNKYVVDLPAWNVGAGCGDIELGFTTYGEAINKISTVDGSPWYEMPSGQVRVDVRDPIPALTGNRTYFSMLADGSRPAGSPTAIPSSAQPRILPDAAYRTYDREVANRIIVRGASCTETGPNGETNNDDIETEANEESPFLPDCPGGPDEVAYPINNELIDTTSKAAEVALRYLDLRDRLITRLQLPVSGDPTLVPGLTVQVNDPLYSEATGTWFLQGYTTELEITRDGGRFVSYLNLIGGEDAGVTGEVDPFADFHWKSDIERIRQQAPGLQELPLSEEEAAEEGMEQEPDLCAPEHMTKEEEYVPEGIGDEDMGEGEDKIMIVVTFDGGPSEDFDGSIVSYAWSDDEGHSGSGQKWTVIYDPDDVSAVDVTLTVTDNDANTDTITKTVYIEYDFGDGEELAYDGGDIAPVDCLEPANEDECLPAPSPQIYVASNTWAFVSQDGGATWIDLEVNTLGFGSSAQIVAACPALVFDDGSVRAGAVYGGGSVLWRTTALSLDDSEQCSESVFNAEFVHIMCDSQNNIWAITSVDIIVSRDGSQTFERFGINPQMFMESIYEVNGEIWIVGRMITSTGGVSAGVRIFPNKNDPYTYRDLTIPYVTGGAQTNAANSLGYDGRNLSIHVPLGPSVVYTEDGETWERASGIISQGFVDGWIVSNGSYYLDIQPSNAFVYYSTDGVNYAFGGDTGSIAQHAVPYGPAGSFIGVSNEHVWVTFDGGATIEPLRSSLPGSGRMISVGRVAVTYDPDPGIECWEESEPASGGESAGLIDVPWAIPAAVSPYYFYGAWGFVSGAGQPGGAAPTIVDAGVGWQDNASTPGNQFHRSSNDRAIFKSWWAETSTFSGSAPWGDVVTFDQVQTAGLGRELGLAMGNPSLSTGMRDLDPAGTSLEVTGMDQNAPQVVCVLAEGDVEITLPSGAISLWASGLTGGVRAWWFYVKPTGTSVTIGFSSPVVAHAICVVGCEPE